jgi:hypothetical protein
MGEGVGAEYFRMVKSGTSTAKLRLKKAPDFTNDKMFSITIKVSVDRFFFLLPLMYYIFTHAHTRTHTRTRTHTHTHTHTHTQINQKIPLIHCIDFFTLLLVLHIEVLLLQCKPNGSLIIYIYLTFDFYYLLD